MTDSDLAKNLGAAVVDGDRRALSRAITLVESERLDDRAHVATLLDQLGPRRDHTVRVGITGIPGVGKSTFIEALGMHIVDRGFRLAVLTVDPSSWRTGGSILGDKTRMEKLSVHPSVYIRPSPSGLTLGGVTRTTHEAISLCEAAGFNVVIIETVGVGQSEVSVADMTDLFVLLLNPSGGDELQGIKRGIVELADVLVVNKADGDLQAAAKRTAADYSSALRLVRGAEQAADSIAQVSALHGTGIQPLWEHFKSIEQTRRHSGEYLERREKQSVHRLWQEVNAQLNAALRREASVAHLLDTVETRVRNGELSVAAGAAMLVDVFRASG